MDPTELREEFPGHAEALRAAARVFDAARVDLWLADATDDLQPRERAADVFAALGARPYLERARPDVAALRATRRVAGHDL